MMMDTTDYNSARETKQSRAAQQSIEGFVFAHYFLDKRLAHGGMAEVFLGRDMEAPEDDERCVVKFILPDLAGDPQFLAMFLNEAQLAAQMDHPNVVKVLDFGEHEGLLYMAMEYVDGLDCWRFARRVYPFGEDHAAAASLIVTQILDALDYVHGMRDVNGHPLHVVHRDLSPSNIYLSRTGEAKLGDFGIARIDSSRYRQITYIPRGKFGYVAPEQIEGGEVDARADIFAMGIVFAELLIGKKLFKGPSQLSVLLEIRDGRFYTLEQHADRIEPRVLAILRKALALSPHDRFQSAAEFRDAVVRCMGDRLNCASVLAGLTAAAAKKGPVKPTKSEAAPPLDLRDEDALVPGSDRRPPSLIPTNPNSLTPSVWDAEDEDAAMDATPITQDFDPSQAWRYRVQIDNANETISVSFSHIMEMIYRDEIGPRTLIAVNDGPFAPADQYPELFRHIPVYTPTLDVSEVKSPDRRGVFGVESPAETVLSLALSDETGLLVCKQEKSRKEIYFKRGTPVYASSNDTRELLGEYLVAKGVIGRDELEMALEVLPKFDGHMGDTLIALGMVSAMELFRAIGDQIQSRFSELLKWRKGAYEFYRGVSCKQNTPEFPINPYVYLSDALFAAASGLDHGAVIRELGEATAVPTGVASTLLRRMSLPADIEPVLQAVTGPTAVPALAASFDDIAAAAALYVGVESGMLALERAMPPWRTRAESDGKTVP